MSYSGSVGRQTIGSLGSSEDSTNGSLKKPTFSERHPKVVRSLTVVAYIFSVSLAAIVLSAYYAIFWSPAASKEPKNGNSTRQCRGVDIGKLGLVQVPRHLVSKNTHSLLWQAAYRPVDGTLPPPQAFIPIPSKLVSNNSQSNSNSSLQEGSSVVNDFSKVSTNTFGKQQQTSVLDEDTQQQTTTVSPSPAPGAIILTRIYPGKIMKRRGRV